MISGFMFRASALLGCAGVMLLSASAAMAQDFSQGSEAKEFGLVGEAKARFSGRVVDILCELSGDCAENCGNGQRQLGVLRESDGKLILVSKNAQFEFNGAVDDLLPYCNKDVDVDGLLLGDDPGVPAKVFMVQLIREKGSGDWVKANQWTKGWKARNPEVAEGEGPWYRRDKRVQKQIAKDGYFGLGQAADAAWRKENE